MEPQILKIVKNKSELKNTNKKYKKMLLKQKLKNKLEARYLKQTKQNYPDYFVALRTKTEREFNFIEINTKLGNNSFIISLTTGITCKTIRQKIDLSVEIESQFVESKNKQCKSCEITEFEKNSCKVACNECRHLYCQRCYWTIYKLNEGLIVCPYCNSKYGRKMNSREVDIHYQAGISNLRDTLYKSQIQLYMNKLLGRQYI